MVVITRARACLWPPESVPTGAVNLFSNPKPNQLSRRICNGCEPNDEASTATVVGVGTETELGISIHDQDWFQIEAQDGQMGTLGIEYTYVTSLGNLNLSAYDDDRDLLGASLQSRKVLSCRGQECNNVMIAPRNSLCSKLSKNSVKL